MTRPIDGSPETTDHRPTHAPTPVRPQSDHIGPGGTRGEDLSSTPPAPRPDIVNKDRRDSSDL